MIELAGPVIGQQASEELAPIIKQREAEMQEIQKAISTVQKDLNKLKPFVEEYEAKMKYRKDLRRELGAAQRAMKTVASFFQGMTLFDARFPLFAPENGNGQETHDTSSHER